MFYKGYELHFCWCGYTNKRWLIYLNKKWVRTEPALKSAKKWINEQLEPASAIKKTASPGTVIHGTMRPEDVIPALCKTLHSLDAKRYDEFLRSNQPLNKALCDTECGIKTDWWESEDALYIIDELSDILEDYAPEGHYFGSHPGDGSDLGFWPNELS